jgi:hypothetical protein
VYFMGTIRLPHPHDLVQVPGHWYSTCGVRVGVIMGI